MQSGHLLVRPVRLAVGQPAWPRRMLAHWMQGGEKFRLNGNGVEPTAEGAMPFDAREPKLGGPPFAEVCERVCRATVAVEEGGASDDLFGEAVGQFPLEFVVGVFE